MGLASIYYCTQPEVFVLPVEVSCPSQYCRVHIVLDFSQSMTVAVGSANHDHTVFATFTYRNLLAI